MEINNNDVFPQNLVDALEKIDRTIEENSGNLDENINISVNATGNTKNIDNSIIDLNKQIDETLNTLDRGVNEHKGAFDIWKTFGVELDTDSFGTNDANKDRTDKDAIYDQLALLAKVLNKNPKLLGTLTSIDDKFLTLVQGEARRSGFLHRGEKVNNIKSGNLTEDDKTDLKTSTIGKAFYSGHVISSPKSGIYENQGKLSSTLFHEYGHMIFNKLLHELGLEYKFNEENVEQFINRIKEPYYETKNEYRLRLLKQFKDGDISFKDVLNNTGNYEKNRLQIRSIDKRTETFLNLLELINTAGTELESKIDPSYVNDVHEVFARSFKNYVMSMSTLSGGKQVTDLNYDKSNTQAYNKKIENAFIDVFNLLEGENITSSYQKLFDRVFNKNLNGMNTTEVSNILARIALDSHGDSGSALDAMKTFLEFIINNNIDLTKYKYSPTNISKILSNYENYDKYVHEMLYKLIDSDMNPDIDKINQLGEIGDIISNLPNYLKSENKSELFNKLSTLKNKLHDVGYDNLSVEEIKTIQEYLEKLHIDEQYNLKDMKTSLSSAMSNIPTSSFNEEKSSDEFSNKVKEQCGKFKSFEECIKSLSDTFKNSFESAIENVSSYFKHTFESAITSYGNIISNINGNQINTSLKGIFYNASKDQELITGKRGTPFVTKDGRKIYSKNNPLMKQLVPVGDVVTDNTLLDNAVESFQAIRNVNNSYKQLLLEYNPEQTKATNFELNLEAYLKEQQQQEEQLNFVRQTSPINYDYLNMITSAVPEYMLKQKMNTYGQKPLMIGYDGPTVIKNDYTYDGFNSISKNDVTEPYYTLIPRRKRQSGNRGYGNYSFDYTNSYIDIKEFVSDGLNDYIDINGYNGNPIYGIDNKYKSNYKWLLGKSKRKKSATPFLLSVKGDDYQKYFDDSGKGMNISDSIFIPEYGYETVLAPDNTNKYILTDNKPFEYTYNEPTKSLVVSQYPHVIEEGNIDRNIKRAVGEDIEDAVIVSGSPLMLDDKHYRDNLEESVEKLTDSITDFKDAVDGATNSTKDFTDKTDENKNKVDTNQPEFLFNDYTKSSRKDWMNGKQGFDAGGKTGLHKDTSNLITWVVDPKTNQGSWKINVDNDAMFKDYKQMMDLNEAATHMQKHMEDYWRFQFSNKTNPELAPLEYLNAKYAERAEYLKKRMENTDTGFASTIYKIGGQEHTYQELLSKDPVLTQKMARINQLVEQIKHANDIDAEGKSTNPLTTYMWLRELSEVEKDIKKRTANVIKEQQTIYKELSDISKEGEKIADEGIKQADKMLAGDSSYKSIFGKYKIPELSRSGKFRLTSEEYQKVLGIEDIIKTKKELLKDDSLDKGNREKLRNEISALNKQLDDYTTGQIADRAREISKIEDHYKKNVMPSLNSFNRIFGHVFNTNADLDYEKIRQGGFGKLKELTKLINVNPFTLNDFKRYMSNFSHYASGMFTSGVKMFQSASAKIGGILTTAIKTTTIAITGAVATVTAAVTGFVAGFTAMGKSIISATDIYRKQTIALTGVYQSPSKSNQMINSVYNITRGMPIDYTQAVQTLSEMSAIPALQTILKSNDSQKADELLNKMFKVITAMTTMRPDQRSSDAIFSLRNAFAGDLRSLQRRFDLPTANIMNVRGTMGLAAVKTDPMALLDSLENYFDTFLDVSTINKVSDTISVIITKIKGAFDLFKANIGNSGFYDLVAKDFRKIRDIVLNFVTSDEGKNIAQRISDVFSNVYNSIKSVALKIKDIISQVFDVKLDSLPDMFTKAMEFFAKSVKYIDSLLNVDKVVFYVKDLTATVKELKKQYEPFIEKVKSGIKDTILMILKVSDTVLDVVGSIITTLKQTGLNDKGLLFLWLFGPGNVISLIGNGVGAITSGIMAAVAGTSLLVSGFKTIAGVIGIASAKLALITAGIASLVVVFKDMDKITTILNTSIEMMLIKLDKWALKTLPASMTDNIRTRYSKTYDITDKDGRFSMPYKRKGGKGSPTIETELGNAISNWNDSWTFGLSNDAKRQIIRTNYDKLKYENGRYSYDDLKALNAGEQMSMIRFTKYLNERYQSSTKDDIFTQMDSRIAELQKKRGETFGNTVLGGTINAVKTGTGIVGGIWNFVKGMFVGGGSLALDKAEEAQKKAKDDADEYKKLFENYMTSDGQFDLDKLNKSIIDGSLTIKDLIKAIKSTKLDRISADPESKNYEKRLRSIAIDIENTGFQRGSAFVTRFKNDDIDKAFSTEFGDFGAKGIEQLNTKRLEAVKSVYNVLEDFAKTPTDWSSLRVLTTMPMTLKRAYSAIESIDGMIYDTVVKSVDIIRETMAKKNNTYLPNDVVNYVMVKRKDMENEIMSEILGTLSLQHSVYFATTNEISGFLNKMEREYKGDMNGLLKDISAGNVDAKELSDTGKQILRELANRYNAEREYYDNLVKQRSYIEVTSQNIGKMSLAAISQNWSVLMNSPYRKIRETAGNVYLDRVKEGLEEDSIGSMVRKVRDIAIESFTDMKTAIINAVQDTVKSTQQTIKNGLDRLIADGGTMKGTFKEVLETIKKNFFGIYTNKAANDITEFIYGSSFTSEKENPMNGVEQKIVELNDKTSTDIKTFQSENNTNFIKAITGIENISSDLKKYTDEVKTQYIKGTAYADSPMGSRAEFPSESGGVTRSGNINGESLGILPDDLAKNAESVADSMNTLNECAKGYRKTLDTFADGAEYAGKKLFGFNSNVVDANDYYRALQNNRYFTTKTMDSSKSLMSQIQYGDTLSWWNGKTGKDMKQHIGIYIGNGRLASDHIEDMNNRDWFKWRMDAGYGLPQISRLNTGITRTGEKDSVTKEFFNTLETVISPEIKDSESEIKDVKTISDTVRIISNTLAQISNMPFGASIYAPTINNMINNVAGGESIGGLNLGNLFGGIFGGLSGSGTFGETGIGKTLNAMATAGGGSGVFGIIGDAVSKASGLSALKTVITASNEKKSTPLKGIWGNLFGTIENVEAGLGHSSAGSFIGNMMAGKGIWDSLAKTGIAAISTKTIGGTKLLEALKGANGFTQVATGLTSTLFGKSAGAAVAKTLTGGNILGMSLGTAIPVVGAIAGVLSKKGWFGGAKDRTAEGKARYADFQSLKQGLIDRRSQLESTYALASDTTRGLLTSYDFGDIAYWEGKRGHKWNGTKRRVGYTDATAFINSLTGYHSLMSKAANEQAQGQVELNALQSTNNMAYLQKSAQLIAKQANANDAEMKKYQDELSKYAGKDANYKQTLFDGKEYTLAELESKVEEFISTFGELSEKAYQLNEDMKKEQLNTEYARLDYELARDHGTDPLMQYNNELKKLELEWKSVNNGRGYEEGTREWYEYMTRWENATQNLENATEEMEKSAKELRKTISSEWVQTLSGIRTNEGKFNDAQVEDLRTLYTSKVLYETAINTKSFVASELRWKGRRVVTNSLMSAYQNQEIVEEVLNRYSLILEQLNEKIDKMTARYNFENTISSYEKNINDKLGYHIRQAQTPVGNIRKYASSLFYVNNSSEDLLATGEIGSTNEFVTQIITPLVDNIYGEFENMMDVYTELYKSGYYSKSLGETKFMNPIMKFMTDFDTYETAYLDALEKNDPYAIDKAISNLNSFLSVTNSYFTNLSNSYAEGEKLLRQASSKQTILNSISGFNDYELANNALVNIRNALKTTIVGQNAFNDLLGVNTGVTTMTGSNIKTWFGVKGEDPYETYYEWQKKTILQQLENADKYSNEYNQAMVDLWNLMLDNAKYLEDKMERLPDTIDRVLGSMSGYEDYEIANSALTEFNKALGKNALNNLVGGAKGLTTFTDSNIAKWFGVSGEDPYETYYEYQKKTILDRIKKEQEGSEDWYNAELDLWNLMMENAKYLKDKAEKTSQTIEDMLDKINETVKTRVAEEAKTSKGDIIFFDLGSTRGGGANLARQMLNAVKTQDPDAQKLIQEYMKKMGLK